jgi:hypothetical protein
VVELLILAADLAVHLVETEQPVEHVADLAVDHGNGSGVD